MVHLHTLEGMRKHYKENLRQYIRDHPGEWVLIERSNQPDYDVSFYRSERALDRDIKKYEGFYGPTFLVERIPKRYVNPETQQRRDLEKYLRKLDAFERRSRRSRLQFD